LATEQGQADDGTPEPAHRLAGELGRNASGGEGLERDREVLDRPVFDRIAVT